MVALLLEFGADPIYRRITGGEVTLVLEGIRAAVTAGFECVKLNTVLLRGLNEGELWALVLFSAELGLPLRFIELMPVSRADVLADANFLPVTEVMERLRARDKLVPQTDHHLGHGPAKYYHLERTGALVGLIGAITNPHFCETCNRVRLTTDGKMRPCLGQHGEVDLRAALLPTRKRGGTRRPAAARGGAEATGTCVPRRLHTFPPDGGGARVIHAGLTAF